MTLHSIKIRNILSNNWLVYQKFQITSLIRGFGFYSEAFESISVMSGPMLDNHLGLF